MKLYMLDEFKWLKGLTNVSFVSLHAARVQFPHDQISITLILSLWANQSFNSFVMLSWLWQRNERLTDLTWSPEAGYCEYCEYWHMSFIPDHQSLTDRWSKGQTYPYAMFIHCLYLFFTFLQSANIWLILQHCVCAWVCMLACGCTQLPTGLGDHIPADMPFRSLVTSAGVSRWQGLFVCVLICSEETWADRQRRQEEGSHNKFPPLHHKMSSFPWLQCAPSHPAEKSRHLKLCDMCHRHCHWASATDGAGIDRPRATGAGWGTHRVWCVSTSILVRDASRAATQTQVVLWDGWSVVAGWHMLDVHLSACEG